MPLNDEVRALAKQALRIERQLKALGDDLSQLKDDITELAKAEAPPPPAPKPKPKAPRNVLRELWEGKPPEEDAGEEGKE